MAAEEYSSACSRSSSSEPSPQVLSFRKFCAELRIQLQMSNQPAQWLAQLRDIMSNSLCMPSFDGNPGAQEILRPTWDVPFPMIPLLPVLMRQGTKLGDNMLPHTQEPRYPTFPPGDSPHSIVTRPSLAILPHRTKLSHLAMASSSSASSSGTVICYVYPADDCELPYINDYDTPKGVFPIRRAGWCEGGCRERGGAKWVAVYRDMQTNKNVMGVKEIARSDVQVWTLLCPRCQYRYKQFFARVPPILPAGKKYSHDHA